MKTNFLSKLVFGYLILSVTNVDAQIGINTSDPKAILHIESSDATNPTGNDGILLPRMNRFPTNPIYGQIIYMYDNANSSIIDGFYMWDGDIWDYFIKAPFNITEDESFYVAQGSGFSSNNINNNSEQLVLFDVLLGKHIDGFSINSNEIIIGRKGTYFVNFTSSLKTTSLSGRRATFSFKVKKNGTEVISTTNSIPNESTTASNIVMSNVVNCNVGDKITVTVIKNYETDTGNISYSGFGNNSLKLNFLHE